MPTFFSMYHGGITPRCGPIEVRCLMALAQGRTSSYETSDIGATPSGRWQFWQLLWRIGAMSLANVTFSGTATVSAFTDTMVGNNASAPTAIVPPMVFAIRMTPLL